MKTCVVITGTNAVGKSSLALELIKRYGGVDRITNQVTYCREGSVCFAGKYGANRFGGVDKITNENGRQCTSKLADVVEEGLRHADLILCEGSMLNTFGLNISNALFKAQHQLVVSLYADMNTIYERLISRSNGKDGKGKRNWTQIANKQKQAIRAAQKWSSIGVNVMYINTTYNSIEQVAELVVQRLKKMGVL